VTTNGPAPLNIERVLADEYDFLHPPPDGAATGSTPSTPAELLRRHAAAGHSALCLSGGGVRSASFGLGVLQGFARTGLLDKFDYLSTVSGGGYIGGWFSAWRLRARERGEPDPAQQLGREVEPEPVTRLRRVIKFLDPRTGLLSADVWTLGGTMLRNLLVNWMVLIPIVAAAAMVPRIYLGLLGLPSQPELVSRATLEWWYFHDWIPVVILIAIGTTFAALQLPSLGRRAAGTRSFAVWFLGPVLVVLFLISVHRFWAWRFGATLSLGTELVVSAAAMVLPWMIGGAFSRRWWRPWTWIAAAAAGLLGRLVGAWAHHFLTALARHDPEIFVVIDLPTSLVLLFLQITVFIGLASRDMSDEDREWWARAGAWILIIGVSWLAAAGIAILGPPALDAALAALGVSRGAGRAGLGLFTVLSGGAAYKMVSLLASTARRWRPATTAALWLAAPLTVVLLVVLVSDGNRALLRFVHDLRLFHEQPHPVGASLPEDLLVFFGLLGAGVALGRVISINQFSLHGMYRSRLVRTFLGVSRLKTDRDPSAFTGFDAADDTRFDRIGDAGPPLHVVNSTLNLVADTRLAVAERRAASFTMSPLHAGARQLGYRPASAYAAGITLGEALTTSGAAVSSNMGPDASRAMTFLLTVFNARLGVWLGNPGERGDTTWTRAAPAFGVAPLVNELLARTTETNPYVLLSDGGHFENLGLYEMVLRRCRFIVVSDAGCDPAYSCGDLANAIRKIRIDFGIDIEFPHGLQLAPHRSDAAHARGAATVRFAVGTIGYSAIDPAIENGVLVYLKPTIVGDEPVDVANYAGTHPSFPHESTAEQWFDEAQFESYRVLGLQTVRALCGGGSFDSPRDLCLAAEQGQL
jgi:hypothetical protein